MDIRAFFTGKSQKISDAAPSKPKEVATTPHTAKGKNQFSAGNPTKPKKRSAAGAAADAAAVAGARVKAKEASTVDITLIDSDDEPHMSPSANVALRRLKPARERKAAVGAAKKIKETAIVEISLENDEHDFVPAAVGAAKKIKETATVEISLENDDDDFVPAADSGVEPQSDTDDDVYDDDVAPKRKGSSASRKRAANSATLEKKKHTIGGSPKVEAPKPKRALVETTPGDFFGPVSSPPRVPQPTPAEGIEAKQSKYFIEGARVQQETGAETEKVTTPVQKKTKRTMHWDAQGSAEKKKKESADSQSSAEKSAVTNVKAVSGPAKTEAKPKAARAFFAGGRRGPVNAGSKEIPTGPPECLSGMSFVLTGVLESLSREDADNLIKEYGGRITSAVSGKTTYLVTGVVLEDDRPVEEGSKYKKAKELQQAGKKMKIINEDGLLDLIRSSSKNSSTSSTAPAVSALSSKVSGSAPSTLGQDLTIQQTSLTTSALSSAQPTQKNTELWTDKYRPKNTSEIVGGQGIANKLKTWLTKWEDTHIHKTNSYSFSKNENMGAKAVLLSGPPGIGKTTLAAVIARELGYEVFEMNASDTRNKAAVQDSLTSVVVSTTVNVHGEAGKPRVVIMDEVDGMSSSDRGGNAALIQVIKQSRNPIICICNDRMKSSVRSLANHCLDLKVTRPQKSSVAKRVVEICRAEGIQAEQNAIELLCETCGNDFRQLLNTLQMWSYGASNVSYRDMKESLFSLSKDKVLRMSAFEGAKSILDRYDAYFVDYSLTPLLVQQNYVKAVELGARGISDEETLERLSRAADAASDSQLADAAVRGGDMHWELLPTQAALNVRIGAIAKGYLPFPAFPDWLGKYSTGAKRTRIARELHSHTCLTFSGGVTSLRLEVVPYLTRILLGPLVRASKADDDKSGPSAAECISSTIELLDEYGLSKEDFTENMKELQIGEDAGFGLLSTKVKSALTREYNKGVHKSQGLVHSMDVVTKKKGRILPPEELLAIEGEEMQNSSPLPLNTCAGEEGELETLDPEEDEDIVAIQAKATSGRPKSGSVRKETGSKRKSSSEGSAAKAKSKRPKKT